MVDGIPSSLVLPIERSVVGDYSSKKGKKNKVGSILGPLMVSY